MPVNFNIELLNTYSKQIEEFSKTNLVSSEMNTRRKLIDPLIELLDWNINTNEVILEYPIKIGSKTINVDFALSTEGKPVVFIEAKAFNVGLSEDFSDQIISYCRVEGVRWAGLTNGKSLMIFDTKRGRRIQDTQICEINLTEPTYYLNELSILHKNSISSGESDSIVDNIINRKQAVRKIREGKDELILGYSQTLTKLIGNQNIDQIQSVSNQLASKTIELFDKEPRVLIIKPPEEKPGKIGKRHEIQKKFWIALINSSKGKTSLFSKRKPSPRAWIGIGAGKTGVTYNYGILLNRADINLYIKTRDKFSNKSIYDRLIKNKIKIEKSFGGSLQWDRMSDKLASKIVYSIGGYGLYDEEHWDDLHNKMIDAMIRLERALSQHI